MLVSGILSPASSEKDFHGNPGFFTETQGIVTDSFTESELFVTAGSHGTPTMNVADMTLLLMPADNWVRPVPLP